PSLSFAKPPARRAAARQFRERSAPSSRGRDSRGPPGGPRESARSPARGPGTAEGRRRAGDRNRAAKADVQRGGKRTATSFEERENAEWTDEEERAKKVIQRVYSGSGHYLRTWINSALNARKCDCRGPSSASETHSRAAHRRASTSRRAAAEHCAAARLPSPRPPRGRALARSGG
ncbi:unnamed protein product, partial [Prorocentrum cordatum]